MKTCLAFVLAAVILAAQPQSVRAQDAKGEQKQEVALDEVKVVAPPIIEGNQVDRYAGQTTTVTKEQISDMNAPDMTSALRRTPGVNISRYNVIGSYGGAEGGGVFVRGMGTSRPGSELATQIDGAPAYMGLWNHPLVDFLSVDPAYNIRVFKSAQPMSAFNNAFAALDVTPKRMEKEGFFTKGTGQYGSFNTWMQTAEHGGKSGNFDYYVGQSFRSSDGHRPNSDGRLTAYYALAGYKLSDNLEVTGTVLHTDNQANDPGPEGQPSSRSGLYTTQFTHGVVTLADNFDWGKGHLKLYANSGTGYWYNQSGTANDTLSDSVLYGGRFRQTLNLWKGGEILAGADLDFMSGHAIFTNDLTIGTVRLGGLAVPVITNNPQAEFAWRTWRVFTPYLGVSQKFGEGDKEKNKDDWYVIPSGGVRLYTHSEFPSEWSPQAGVILGWKGLELHGNYSRGVSYPGLNVAVFSANVISTLGQRWRDLRAEVTDHFEAGASYSYDDKAKLDVTFYSDHGSNKYVMYPATGAPQGFANIAKFDIQGVESTLTVTPLKNLSLFAGMNYLNVDPKSLPYSPKWTLSFGGNYLFLDHFKLSADAQYVDQQYVLSQARRINAYNTSKVDAFWLLNAKFSYLFSFEAWKKTDAEVFVAVNNITNTFYKYRPGYPMPPTSVMTGLSVSF
ncbi:MAG: TonB-dependent receptor plug domain-containing protein [Desulfovibrio sp.]|nr:TonB-dependent receptor plug domain-containing protein [Desulfovibrio sp.]MBI4961273.1 TonB-dependent receptor plug domain-containing protein [Desulfovibrio sp.]